MLYDFVKNNEDALKANKLATYLLTRNANDYWQEIKKISNYQMPLSMNIYV